jgi:hypothetical protein
VLRAEPSAAGFMGLDFEWTFTPSAGSHIIAPAWAAVPASDTLRARTDAPLIWTVEELVRQNTANNATTSG